MLCFVNLLVFSQPHTTDVLAIGLSELSLLHSISDRPDSPCVLIVTRLFQWNNGSMKLKAAMRAGHCSSLTVDHSRLIFGNKGSNSAKDRDPLLT